jgi:hypothetical protein
MGIKVNAQVDHNSEYVLAVQRMNELVFKHERLPWMWLRPIWYLTGNEAEYNRNLKLLTDFTRNVSKCQQECNHIIIGNRQKTQ